MKNYDRIKAMNVEEMADFLMGFKECRHCQVGRYRKNCYEICENKENLLQWLESEVSE